jgi:hypothetical protein
MATNLNLKRNLKFKQSIAALKRKLRLIVIEKFGNTEPKGQKVKKQTQENEDDKCFEQTTSRIW